MSFRPLHFGRSRQIEVEGFLDADDGAAETELTVRSFVSFSFDADRCGSTGPIAIAAFDSVMCPVPQDVPWRARCCCVDDLPALLMNIFGVSISAVVPWRVNHKG